MRGMQFDRILAGTALALVLTLSGQANAQSNNPAPIEAGVPVPEPANVPPPTAADIAKGAPSVTPAAQGTMFETPRRGAATCDAGRRHHRRDRTGDDPRRLRSRRRPQHRPPIRSSARSCAKFSPPAATASSAAKARSAGVEAFYRDRNYAPLWVNNGAPTARATEAIAYLRGVDADGLEPSEYPAPDFKAADPAAMAEAELKFTATVLTFARHAANGRVHWSRVSQDIFYNEDPVEPAALLGGLAGSKTAGETLGSYLPQHSLYKALKEKLAEARKQKGDNAPTRIGAGPVLKTGKVLVQDERVPALREKLGLTGDKSDITYDKELEDAVAKFQKKHGLPAERLAHRCDHRGDERPAPRSRRRHHHGQSRALALDAARARQDPRRGQHSGLHAAALPQRPALLEHAHRRRQAEPGDRRS